MTNSVAPSGYHYRVTISEPRSEASSREALRQRTYPRRQFLAYQREIVGQPVGRPGQSGPPGRAPASSDPEHPMTFATWLAEAEASAS